MSGSSKRKDNEEPHKEAEEGGPPTSKRKKEAPPIITERDEVPRLPPSSPSVKILSWNINGWAALYKSNLAVLEQLVAEEKPDLLCLQETKLQEQNVEAYKNVLKGYSSYWNCSQTKKGYAGTAVFVRGGGGGEGTHVEVGGSSTRKKEKTLTDFFKAKPKASTSTTSQESKEDDGKSRVLGVTYGIGNSRHDEEGRTITVEYPSFFVVNVYVPNSGMKLERLEYRLKEWEPDFRAYLDSLRVRKPVILTGDMNVAHLDLDMYNASHKHIVKVPGCTPQERESHTAFLETTWVDVFRLLNGDAKGQYTYWSIRNSGRQDNRGLRLDTFIISDNALQPESPVKPHECYILHQETLGVSDHCPIGLTLSLK